MGKTTQRQCPGYCHDARENLGMRQKDSAKDSRFMKVKVAL